MTPGDNLHAAALQSPGIGLTPAASMGTEDWTSSRRYSLDAHSSTIFLFFSYDLVSSLIALGSRSKRNEQQSKRIFVTMGYLRRMLNSGTFNNWAVNCVPNSRPLNYANLQHGSRDSTGNGQCCSVSNCVTTKQWETIVHHPNRAACRYVWKHNRCLELEAPSPFQRKKEFRAPI